MAEESCKSSTNQWIPLNHLPFALKNKKSAKHWQQTQEIQSPWLILMQTGSQMPLQLESYDALTGIGNVFHKTKAHGTDDNPISMMQSTK